MPDEELLAHMLDAAGRIQSYLTGITRDQFMQNRLRQDAVIRCLQVIGEASRRVSNDMRIDHPEIEWRTIVGMRTVVIHEFHRIKLNMIWDVTQDDIPALIAALLPLVPPEQ
ncbi:MAG: DUF86 domain-containing protein [Chloroflexi bacterium]|uniref:HepT-like ribonuclease domain-containing protein n=1 Tax=Candidatus Flexifilum breve TaxID=3140694 RepID=UPI0031347255|nr:DUF86 domain-containing protein [Chloroflexota bacterium]